MLRSIYNRGVESGRAPYVHRLFHDVYTGVDICQKKALPVGELNRLLYEDPKSERLRRTQAIAALMFQFCGMSFADLAHLEKSSLERNIIRYNRIKTKTPMSVEVLDTAQDIISRLRNCQPSHPDCPDYLFSILLGDKKREDESAYREYQSALRRFNNRLKRLAKALRLTSPVTSYTIRHSWATTAKYRGVPIEMISESLGHKSIKTTQIYLKGFGLQERTEAPNADRLRLRQQLVDVVHRDFGLSLLLRLMAHSARERDYGGHVSVVVDGLGVVRQCFRCRGPATVAMVVLAHGFSV